MSQGTMAQRIVIPERRSSSMYNTGLQAPPKPFGPTSGAMASPSMMTMTSLERNASPPPLYSKSVLRTPSQTGVGTTSATVSPSAATNRGGTSEGIGGNPSEVSPKAAAALSLSELAQTSTPSTPQRDSLVLPSTPPTNRRLAAVRSSSSLTIDRSSLSNSLTQTRPHTTQASGFDLPRRPPLDSTQSSPNLSIRSIGSPRSLPPQSEPPMSPIPPTPDRAPSRTQPSSPRRMTAPPSPRSTKSSHLSELALTTSREDDESIDPLTSVKLTPASPTKAAGSPLPSSNSLLFSDSQGGSSSSAGLFVPRLEPPPRPAMASSRRGSESRAASTLGPPTPLGGSDRRPSGSSASGDVRRGSASSLPSSPPSTQSNSRLAEQRRSSMASVSSTSTFRVRRKPTPSEHGDDMPTSPRSGSLTADDTAAISELRRGSTGSRDSRQGVQQTATSLPRHLQPLAEAQTPGVTDARLDLASGLPAAVDSSAAVPISTVMVDGQAFVLGDNSPSQASAKAPRAVSSSHDSPLAHRSPPADSKIGPESRGTAARQQAIAMSMARSASIGHGRAPAATPGDGPSSGVQRSSSGRAKGLGDGRGFARRPGSAGNAAITPSLSKRDASAATEGARNPSAGVDPVANEDSGAGEMTEAQEEAAAGTYAIDPPTEEALAQAASLSMFTETGDLQNFGEIFAKQRTLVCFLRHWFCPMCQEYAMSMANLDPLPLQRANLGMIVVGQGHPHVLAAYKRVMGVPDWIQMYADPSRKIYHALGMTKRTNDPGPACAKPDYITMSIMKGSMQAVKKGLFQMPVRLPGDTKLLGGEFIFGPGLQTSFTHRMVTTRGHLDVPRILVQAGCDMSLKTPKAIDREASQSNGAHSVGRSASRRRASHNVRRVPKRYEGSERNRSVTAPVGKRKDGTVMKKKSSGQVPAVPKIPLAALFATGLDGTPAKRHISGDIASESGRRQPSASVEQPRTQRTPETQVSPATGRRRPSTAPDAVESSGSGGLSGAGKAELTQEEIRERQRQAFAAGPSNSPAGPASDSLRKASDAQPRRSFDRSASLSRSAVGRTPSQARREQPSHTVDSGLNRTPSLSKQSPATKRTQFITPSREDKESLYGTPASAFAINSDSPLVQELRRSLSRHEPTSDLDDDGSHGKGAKLVRQVTQSRRPEVVTPTQIIHPETVVTDGSDTDLARSSTPTERLRSDSVLSAAHDIGTSTPRQEGMSRKISHRQLRLEGGAPSVRPFGSPPATPKSASLNLMRDSQGALPGLFNSPTKKSATLPEGSRDSLYSENPRLRKAEHAAAAATTPVIAQGETAQVDSWSDEEEDSGDTSIADSLEQHEKAIRHQASLGSLSSSRLSSPRKAAPALQGHEAGTYAGMPSSKTVMPDTRFASPNAASGNGGGASFLDELDMIDGFVRHARGPRDRGSADDMPRYSFESSLGEEEETEPADSDSDMEHESGWIRPRSSRSMSSSQRSTYNRANGRSTGVRASEDSNVSRGSESVNSFDASPLAPRQRGLGALTPTRPSFQSSRMSEDTDFSYDDQGDEIGEQSFRTTSMGRSVQQSGDEDDADYDSAGDEEDRPGRLPVPGGNRSRASTPHHNGQLSALVEGEEEGESMEGSEPASVTAASS